MFQSLFGFSSDTACLASGFCKSNRNSVDWFHQIVQQYKLFPSCVFDFGNRRLLYRLISFKIVPRAVFAVAALWKRIVKVSYWCWLVGFRHSLEAKGIQVWISTKGYELHLPRAAALTPLGRSNITGMGGSCASTVKSNPSAVCVCASACAVWASVATLAAPAIPIAIKICFCVYFVYHLCHGISFLLFISCFGVVVVFSNQLFNQVTNISSFLKLRLLDELILVVIHLFLNAMAGHLQIVLTFR